MPSACSSLPSKCGTASRRPIPIDCCTIMVKIIAITLPNTAITVSARSRPVRPNRPKQARSRSVPVQQPGNLPKLATPNQPLLPSTSSPILSPLLALLLSLLLLLLILVLLLLLLLLPLVLLLLLLPLAVPLQPALLEFHLFFPTLPSPPKPPPPPKLNPSPPPPPPRAPRLAISLTRSCPSIWKFEYRISVFQHSVSLWKARIRPGCKAPSRLRFWGPPALDAPASYSNFSSTTFRRTTSAPASGPSTGAAWSVIPAYGS
uniref:Uncharacterized protein n=1 Tax=Anopheles merus TaxID=30066 RepID=A0A182UME9_ANOME